VDREHFHHCPISGVRSTPEPYQSLAVHGSVDTTAAAVLVVVMQTLAAQNRLCMLDTDLQSVRVFSPDSRYHRWEFVSAGTAIGHDRHVAAGEACRQVVPWVSTFAALFHLAPRLWNDEWKCLESLTCQSLFPDMYLANNRQTSVPTNKRYHVLILDRL